MKEIVKSFIVSVAIVAAGIMPVGAQEMSDEFVVGFGFSVPATSGNDGLDGAPTYNGGFRKYEIYGAYEKFVWKGLFVMPEVSLWYSDNYDDKLTKAFVGPSTDPNPDLKYGKESAWQIGGTISAYGAWRQSLGSNFSVDVLTGPRMAINLKGHIEGMQHEFDDFYRAVRFEWRFGAAANICTRWRLGVNFDLRPGHHKAVSTGVGGLAWTPSGRDYRNSWTFSVGYRF